MNQVISRFIHQARNEQGLSTATIEGYQDDLRKFAAYLRDNYGRNLLPGDVTPEMIHRFMEFLGGRGYRRRNGPASRAKRLASIWILRAAGFDDSRPPTHAASGLERGA